jgi:hypothetical protein
MPMNSHTPKTFKLKFDIENAHEQSHSKDF